VSIDRTAALEALLIDAEAAHAIYERTELDGVYDEAWPRWYAQHLVDHGIDRVLQRSLDVAEVAALLQDDDAATAGGDPVPTESWSARTARRIAAASGPSPEQEQWSVRTNPDVDAWFERYDNPMRPVVQRLRELVLAADPRIEETIKWQAPTFIYRGNLASFYPKSKAHASLMFHEGARIPGDHPRLEGTGDTSRVLKVASIDEAEAARPDIEAIVRAWCEWRDSR
jgi:hypothetical protein